MAEMPPQSESFKRALARFERDVGPRRAQEFANCSLHDVQLLMKKIQAEQERKGEMRHLKRLEPFLEAMEKLGKVIEVFTNTTVFLCYVWGPIKFLLGALTRRKEILNSEKLSASLDQIIKLRDEIHEINTRQKQVADKQEEETHKERKRAIMGKLSIPDYQSDYRFFIEGRDYSDDKLETSSGTWIFDDPIFQAWHLGDASGKRVLYIHGRPGGGVALAFFYFRRQNPNKDNFNSLLRALLGQLYDRDPILAAHIEIETSKHDVLRTKVLQELVSTAVGTYPTTYLVLDGLDECSNEEEERTIKWLLALCDHSPGLRILFSGQRDGVLDHLLRSFKSAHSILLDTAPGHVGNIKNYCECLARDIQAKFEPEPSLEQVIIDLVSENAGGMFLYAKLVLEHLLGQYRTANLKRALQPGIFPASLEEVYEKLEDRLHKGSSDDERKAAIQILSYVVCCKRTLFWREIQSFFSIDQLKGEVDYDNRPAKNYKQLCGSFLDSHTVNKDYTGPEDEVHLVHETAREFLIRREIVNTTRVHSELSVFCSQYLLSPPFAPGIAEDKIISYARRGSYALQDYAVQYWLDHLRESVNASGTLQSAGCQDAIQWAYLFLQSYGDHAKMSTLDDAGGFPSVDQVADRIPEHGCERNNYFNIEERTEAIRQVIGKLNGQIFTSGEAKILSQLQGPMNVHKCSKPWCIFFKGNLQTAEAREEHISRHERPFCCLLESCPMFAIGYSSSAELQKHNSKYHTQSSNRNRFPKLDRGSLPDDVDEKPEFMDLMLASRRGDMKTIDDLLGARTQKDARQMVNEKDKSTGETPLYIAAQNGHGQACEALLRWGADANAVVKLLLDTGTRVGRTALYIAVQNGHEAVVKLLLDTGNRDGRTALYIAVQNGHEAVVKLLIDTGKVDAGAKYGYEQTALHIAAGNGHEAVVKLLLDTCKVDAGARDGDGQTALHMAAKNGHEAVVKLLIDTGKVDADPKEWNGRTALYMAAENGHQAVVKLLLDTGKVDADPKEWYGRTALYVAAENGHQAVVKLLLDTGNVDADPKAIYKRTALHMAAENGHQAVVKLLLDTGKVDADVQDCFGWTALHMAAKKGREAVVKLLLDTGKVDASIKQFGRAALHIAAENGHEAVVKLLLSTGKVDASAQGRFGWTALHMAARNGHEAVVKLLLDTGKVDAGAKDRSGRTARHMAAKNGLICLSGIAEGRYYQKTFGEAKRFTTSMVALY
ncbi:ankyrin repeat-containing domain protein [Pseudoneurospora amorphoporcata]|uniref:Ankyrin repeat-containing domain protein n=1 Tax=Pseudoneurospora amorphoporcata TaxID=241081 RepID=A0AAN6SBW1_9PEZI|nr:ankyrin repeat-containing domain protein [Pseudoneurospora amorphoporcata]